MKKQYKLKAISMFAFLFIFTATVNADCVSDFSSGYAAAQDTLNNHMTTYCDPWLEIPDPFNNYGLCSYEATSNFNHEVDNLLATFNACCPHC